MRAITRVENVANVELAMTITMPLGEWEKLSGQLATQWPASDLVRIINASLRQMKEATLADSERSQ